MLLAPVAWHLYHAALFVHRGIIEPRTPDL